MIEERSQNGIEHVGLNDVARSVGDLVSMTVASTCAFVVQAKAEKPQPKRDNIRH